MTIELPEELPDDETSAAAVESLVKLITDRRMEFAADEEGLGGIAVGWAIRMARTAEAAVVLYQNGFGSEAAPLVRSCMQHAAALAWLPRNRSTAHDVVEFEFRRHRNTVISEATAAGWDIGLSEEIREVLDQQDSRPDGLATFRNFQELCRHIDFPLLYIAYRIESALTHPSLVSATTYWHDGTNNEQEGFNYREPSPGVGIVWIAFVLLIGACSLDELNPEPEFQEGLVAIDRSLGLGFVTINSDPSVDPDA